ncbi:MAG: glycoside hydrolase family 25 protein [Lachnospiraceae bacterium]|nr:glycoside hydrolase family 25 protein [Lachnospiraceae bacterium]
MDSKWRSRAILISLLMILLTLGIVGLSNAGKIRTLLGEEDTVTETAEVSNGDLTSPTSEIVTGSFQEGFAGSDPAGQLGDSLSAFWEDETFFDREKSEFEKMMEQEDENENRLYFIITSVEHDMRIQIVNFDNQVITGVPFVVNVRGQGSYQDADKDGVVYVSGLSAGKYAVSLDPAEGYSVPEETTVSVKAKVEYTPIEDISLLIKSEDEIDVSQEDTGITNALEEADDTEMTDLIDLAEMDSDGSLGIDVSKWNGEIDWEAVRDNGITFAIIRAGYRGSASGVIVEDPYFEQNIKGAMGAGLNVGVYFFTQATGEVEAVEEASAVLKLCQNYRLQLPIYIDTEGAGGNGRADHLDMETRTTVCDAFCKTIESANIDSGIYASKNWYINNLNMNELDPYRIWLAEYRKTPTYEGNYHMWQYTSSGSVDGIAGRVDLDIWYGDR